MSNQDKPSNPSMTASPTAVSEEQMQEYRDVFDVFDRNKDGTISAAEIYGAMKQLGRDPTPAEVEQILRELDINGDGQVEFSEFVELLDKEADLHLQGVGGLFKKESQKIPQHQQTHSQQPNHNGSDRHSNGASQTQPQTKAEREKASAEEVKRRRELAKEREGREMFRSFDQDGDGHVDKKELADVMNGIGEKLKDEEISRMISEADVDGDGKVNFQEFRKMTGQ